MRKERYYAILLLLFIVKVVSAQFVHPGLIHKMSDLERMKAQVEAQIDPWYTSYQDMVADSKSSYDYEVRGEPTFTELGRDDGTNYGAWKSDIRAAHYNAIRWYVEGDTRHAEKSIEIFNAWKNLTSVTSGGTDALSGGVGYIMIEAAEIIRHTYDGWSASDIKDFEDMLVYPGYSTTAEPSGNTTFYWMSFQGDPIRHGNQGLSGWRTVLAMGIFMDNEIMYDRALRYVQGLPHREDDLPYPAGPNTRKSLTTSSEYSETYSVNRGYSQEDYGYNEVMTNYIWENGQCQESSRDQQHTMFGIGLLTSMAEMAWSQGDDLYSHEDDRLLLGLEYNMKYNTTTDWIPTVASGEFIERDDRTMRWRSLAVSPTGRGEFPGIRTVFEMPVAHYVGRGFKTTSEVQYTTAARDMAIEESGYEKDGWTNDALGWGALVSRRPDFCYGDPISGFDAIGLPVYAMNTLPMTIEAENFDTDAVSGEDRIYHDEDSINTGAKYRLDEGVDIDTCAEGGYQLMALEEGEWLSYTIAVPSSALYAISIRYASASANGKLRFSVAGEDITDEISVPFGGENSKGLSDWREFTIADNVIFKRGVQALTIHISGESNTFVLDNFTITESDENTCDEGWASTNVSSTLTQGVNYSYYEGTWDSLPDFSQLTPLAGGISNIELNEDWSATSFGVVYSGYIDIPIGGMYTFYASSNEAVRLYLDENLLIDSDSSEAELVATACLQEGYHAIRVEYYETAGTDGLLVEFEGPGTSKSILDNYLNVSYPFASIEAEDYTEANGTDTESCSDTGGGENIGSIKNGHWLKYSNVNLSEVHSINMRLASKNSGGTIEVRVGAATGTLLGTLEMPNTANWQVWETVSAPLESLMGVYDVYLVFKSSATYVGNINWLEFSSSTIQDPSTIENLDLSEIVLYPNPVENNLTVVSRKEACIAIYNSQGSKVLTGIANSNEHIISMESCTAGVYFVKVSYDGIVKSFKIIKK